MKKILSVTLALLLPMMLLASAEHRMEKEFSVKKGGELRVDSDLGSIQVNTHGKNSVKAVIYFKNKYGGQKDLEEQIDDLEIHMSKMGDDVLIELKKRREKNWWGDNKLQIHFEILVPEAFNVDLNTAGGSISVEDLDGRAKCRTSGGSLRFGYIKGTVDGNTSGGSVTIEGCEGDVEAKTSGGSINIGSAKGNVEAYTSGGSIEVDEVFGNIQAKTSGGHINCTLTKQPTADCTLKTSGGSIEVNLKSDIRVTVNARTSGGRVRTDFPVMVQGELNSHHLDADINGGGPRLTVQTSGGGIRINEI